jgi:hypothetical protein
MKEYPNVQAAIPLDENGEVDWSKFPPILGYTSYLSCGFPVFTHDHPCYSTASEYFDDWPLQDLRDALQLLHESALNSIEIERKKAGKTWHGYKYVEYPEQDAIAMIQDLIFRNRNRFNRETKCEQ